MVSAKPRKNVAAWLRAGLFWAERPQPSARLATGCNLIMILQHHKPCL